MSYQRENWRNYQHRLKKEEKGRKLRRFLFKSVLFLPLILISAYAVFLFFSTGNSEKALLNKNNASAEAGNPSTLLTKEGIHNLIDVWNLKDFSSTQFRVNAGEKQLVVKTSIDNDLQSFLKNQIKKVSKKGRGRPKYLAIVAMDPASGRILAMAGYDQDDTSSNPCVQNIFPAASIFKIITAAAAVEECGLTPYSKMKFNGGKYTLYKRQLKERNNKYTNRISFKDSFAQSVNPVFGKIGSLYLGKQTLEKYASAFGFNKEIPFEIPIPVSRISVTDEPYQWAEIASGFNRKTKISPLHGALLSGAVINRGILPEPTIIEKIIDPEGNLLYSGNSMSPHQAIKPETSAILKKLMATTIRSGTGKKSFKGYRTDPVLGRLNIGGKTGSIFNSPRDVKFDWFVGYAEEKKGQSKLAVSVVVGHKEYIGTKACKFARITMTRYFQHYFAAKEKKKSADDHPEMAGRSQTVSQNDLI